MSSTCAIGFAIEGLLQQVHRAAVQLGGGDDVSAASDDREQGHGDRRLAGGDRHG
jgi:hypothetical protein